ncbi:hypothetical protein FO519_003074 [Halicephalobus sp. NKZ332]|nr:hypothetical protein FO519_003074 [Halicephalobus sp. NKZ332]
MDVVCNDANDTRRDYSVRLAKLYNAIISNNYHYVEQKLLRRCFHVDARDGDFVTPLLLATMHGHIELVRLFLQHRARVNEGNQIGITPVLAACAKGHLRILHELIKSGADMRPSDLGITPMGMACAHGQLEIVKYLVAGGLSIDPVPGSVAPSPLMLAAMNNHDTVLVYFLLPNLRGSQRLNSLPTQVQQTLRKMIEEAVNIPKVDIDETIPELFHLNLLALAVVTHNRPLFELLYELGADLKHQLPSGRTVAQVAQKYKFDLWLNYSDSTKGDLNDTIESPDASFTHSKLSNHSKSTISSLGSKNQLAIMANNFNIPDTIGERLAKVAEESPVLRNPDSPDWFKRDVNEKSKEDYAWSAPYDARFPQVRKQRQCFAYYVDFHRCKELMGEDYSPCKFFQNVYKDFCPNYWVEKWDELRDEGRFPAKFDPQIMTEVSRVDPKEIRRREDYIREYQRPRNLRDPFTWSYPYRAAGCAVAICMGAAHMHNLWMRKPWHYALYLRLAAIGTAGLAAYGLGTLRERHYRTREAVTEHYKSLHQAEFIAVDDIYGRPFASIVLPWYPRRPQYRDNRQ